jgi:hypothetical protein
MRRMLARYGYWTVTTLALAGNLLAGAYLVLVVLPDVMPPGPPVTTPTPMPTELDAMPMRGVLIPATVECAACHLTAGGYIGTRTRPLMAHPIDGWRNCTECHAPNRLVDTAPGHSGIHKEDCLACHQPPSEQGPAPRPHHVVTNTACVTCHGARAEAPLPTDMAGRHNCWVCHGVTNEDIWKPKP